MGLMNVATPIGAFSAGFLAPLVLDAFWVARHVCDRRHRSSHHRVARAAHPGVAEVSARASSERCAHSEISEEDCPGRRSRDSERSGERYSTSRVPIGIASRRISSAHASAVGHARAQPFQSVLARELAANAASSAPDGIWRMRCAAPCSFKVAALPAGFSCRVSWTGVPRGPHSSADSLLSAAALIAFNFLPWQEAWVALLLFAGAGISGSQLSLNALSAAYYPSAIKATGVAWALVIGGIGSVAGPMVGAELIDLGLVACVDSGAAGDLRRWWHVRVRSRSCDANGRLIELME